MNITDLQSRINERARKEANDEIDEAVNKLPHFDKLELSQSGSSLTYNNYQVLAALKEAMFSKLYKRKVEAISHKILDAVDQLEDLVTEVDNIQRGN